MSCPEDYKKCEHYVSNAPSYRKCIKDSSIGECGVEIKTTLDSRVERRRIELKYKLKKKFYVLFNGCILL